MGGYELGGSSDVRYELADLDSLVSVDLDPLGFFLVSCKSSSADSRGPSHTCGALQLGQMLTD